MNLDVNEGSVPHFAREVLKNFSKINSLHIQLPPSHGGGLRSSNSTDSLLKWKAEFGRELKSCVLLGEATSFYKISSIHEDEHHKISHDESNLTGDELKLRTAWMISCLFAASTRHCLLKQIISNSTDHPMLRSVVIGDASKQGTVCMGEEQLEELRACVNSSMEIRTRFPALLVKLWYVSVLELPDSGHVMQRATLIIVRPAPADPSLEMESDSHGDFLEGVFHGEEEEEAFNEAMREMVKDIKPYIIGINSF